MNLSICITCYVVFLFLYSIIIIAIEATSFYVGLTFAILPLLCYILLNWFAIPKPSEAAVHEILGENLWQNEAVRSSFESDSSSSLDDNAFVIRTIAHRGCGLDAPENSIAAMKLCKKNGCKCIEIDVFLTADKIAVVFHDDTLDRMTDGVGLISEHTYEDLQRLQLVFQPKFDAKDTFADERIPTLDECIAFCMESNTKLILDVKDSSNEV
ncbi:hypothetical protein LSTR_LSTR012616 [Laodelphax striatellus]|uniref:GP-PDE domain-containing protein n=1 Tax=Laodelphax striatellus TaxID=195883 RepID=A0A482XNT1_LAOST|nr:hypothetical protein LSTR_LSTR012616 [Laodelphax striatellus]